MRANLFNSLRLTFLYQTGEGGILSKILHGYAPPRGPTSFSFIYHFEQKNDLFPLFFVDKWYPFHILL